MASKNDKTVEINGDELDNYRDLDGAEFLNPPAALRTTTKGRLVARLEELAADDDTHFDALMDLIEFLEKYCAKPGFSAWLDDESEGSRLMPALKLAVAYAQEVGKAFTSTAS